MKYLMIINSCKYIMEQKFEKLKKVYYDPKQGYVGLNRFDM